MNSKDMASVCHAANRAYSRAIGQDSAVCWEDYPLEMRKSAERGVDFLKINLDISDEDLHEAWLKDKLDAGWVYGPIKSIDNKTHPCMKPFSDLDKTDQVKDSLFNMIVRLLDQGKD